MNEPVAFQVAQIGNCLLYRPMNQVEYNAFQDGEPVDEDTIFTAFDVPQGQEVSNIVIRTNGEIFVTVISKS